MKCSSSEQQAQVLADLLKPLLPLHPGEAGLKSQDKEEHGGDRGDRLLLIVLGLQDDLEDNTKPVGKRRHNASHAEDTDDRLGSPHQHLSTIVFITDHILTVWFTEISRLPSIKTCCLTLTRDKCGSTPWTNVELSPLSMKRNWWTTTAWRS